MYIRGIRQTPLFTLSDVPYPIRPTAVGYVKLNVNLQRSVLLLCRCITYWLPSCCSYFYSRHYFNSGHVFNIDSNRSFRFNLQSMVFVEMWYGKSWSIISYFSFKTHAWGFKLSANHAQLYVSRLSRTKADDWLFVLGVFRHSDIETCTILQQSSSLYQRPKRELRMLRCLWLTLPWFTYREEHFFSRTVTSY